MKALVVSLESFQKGEIPEEVKKYILSQHGNIFTVLDESSKIKTNNPCKESKKSKRTQAILKLNRIGERCILTGTFLSKSPINAYDQMNFLCPDFFPESMYAFAEHYELRRSLPSVRGARITLQQKDYETIRKRLEKYSDSPSALAGAMDGVHSFYGITREDCFHILDNKEYTPFKNMDELWKRIGDNCIRVKREDVLDMPPKIYKSYNVEMTAEQKKLYLQLQNQHCTDDIVVDNGLKLYLRFQDVLNGYNPVETKEFIGEDGEVHHNVELVPLKENPKIDMLLEVLEEIGDKQTIVWCSRTKLLQDAKKAMEEAGYAVGVYDGKVNKEDRERDYKLFSEKKLNILICNQRSAGYGLDGMKNADYSIYLSNSYSVEERVQSEARSARGNITRSKYVIDIQFKGTCEDRVVEALKQGKELVDSGAISSDFFRYTGD